MRANVHSTLNEMRANVNSTLNEMRADMAKRDAARSERDAARAEREATTRWLQTAIIIAAFCVALGVAALTF